MPLCVHLGYFNGLASLRPRAVLARLARIVALDRSVRPGRHQYHVTPDTLPAKTGVSGAGAV